MATSRPRPDARIKSRFATFAQAISNTSTPAVINASHTVSVTRPTNCSLMGTMVVRTPVYSVGKALDQVSMYARSSAAT